MDACAPFDSCGHTQVNAVLVNRYECKGQTPLSFRNLNRIVAQFAKEYVTRIETQSRSFLDI